MVRAGLPGTSGAEHAKVLHPLPIQSLPIHICHPSPPSEFASRVLPGRLSLPSESAIRVLRPSPPSEYAIRVRHRSPLSESAIRVRRLSPTSESAVRVSHPSPLSKHAVSEQQCRLAIHVFRDPVRLPHNVAFKYASVNINAF